MHLAEQNIVIDLLPSYFSFPFHNREGLEFSILIFSISIPLSPLPFWKIDRRPREVGRNKSRVKVGEWGGER